MRVAAVVGFTVTVGLLFVAPVEASRTEAAPGDSTPTSPAGDWESEAPVLAAPPSWPVPDKPIPHHEPGRLSRAASYETTVAIENDLGVPDTIQVSGVDAMAADGLDPLAGNYRLVPMDKIVQGSYLGGSLQMETFESQGGFVHQESFRESLWSSAVALGDLDGDGDMDAVVTDNDSGGADEVWMNDGAARFHWRQAFRHGHESSAVALGDLDGDNDLDAVIADRGLGADEVWLNDGYGRLEEHQSFRDGAWSSDVALGDLDGDSNLDAVITNPGSGGGDEVWLGDGSGTLTLHQEIRAGTVSSSVFVGDLDGDADLDAIFADPGAGPDEVWKNDGTGSFTLHQGLRDGPWSSAVALGDLDGDSDLDAVITDPGRPWMFGTNPEPSDVWRNDGDGTLTLHQQLTPEVGTAAVALGDLEGDGDLDALVTDTSTGPVDVWLYQASGLTLQTAATDDLGDHKVFDITAGDVNGDGQDEQIAARFEQDHTIALSIGEMHGSLGRVTSAPATVVHQSGAVDVLVRGYDEALWHRHRTALGDWGAWENGAGGLLLSAPSAIAQDGDGFVVFALFSDNQVWQRRWDGASWVGSGWTRVEPTGAWPTMESWHGETPELHAPAVVARDARLDLFRVAADNTLMEQHYDGVAWSGWTCLGGMLSSGPAVVVSHDGTMAVFARGLDDAIWYRENEAGVWHQWRRVVTHGLPPDVSLDSAPTAAESAPGQLDVFARGSDGGLWHIRSAGGHWTTWSLLGGQIGSAVALGTDGWTFVARAERTGDLVHSHTGAAWQPAGGLPPCCQVSQTSLVGVERSMGSKTTFRPGRDFSLDVETGHVLGNGREQLVLGYQPTGGRLRIVLSEVGGAFTLAQSHLDAGAYGELSLERVSWFRIAVGDFVGGDGVEEIAIAHEYAWNYGITIVGWDPGDGGPASGRLRVMLESQPEYFQEFAGTLQIADGDLDGDGQDEIAMLIHTYGGAGGDDYHFFARLRIFDVLPAGNHPQGRVGVFHVADDRTLGAERYGNIYGQGFALAAGDFDGDGLDELVRTWPVTYGSGHSDKLQRSLHVIDLPANEGPDSSSWSPDGEGKIEDATVTNVPFNGECTPQGALDRLVVGDLDSDLVDEFVWQGHHRIPGWTRQYYAYDPVDGAYEQLFSAPLTVRDTPVLVAGDFTRDGVQVGRPSYRVQTRVDTLLARINMPPKHKDLVELPDGSIRRLESPEGDCTPSSDSPDCTHAKYAKLDWRSAEQSLTTQHAYQISAGVEQKACVGADLIVVSGETCIKNSIDLTHGGNFEKSTTSIDGVTFRRKVIAATDDKLVYYGTPYGVWEYPVLRGGATHDEGMFITVAFPLITRTRYPDTAGGYLGGTCDEAWYASGHQPNNVWSYSPVGDVRFSDYEPGTAIAYDAMEGDWAEGAVTYDHLKKQFSSVAFNHGISVGTEISTHTEGSYKIFNASSDFRAYFNGDYSHSSLSTDTLTNGSETEYSYFLAPQPDDLKYTTRVLFYRARDGSFVLNYQTEPGRGAGWQLYDRPDPAFILPWYGLPDPDEPVAPPCGKSRQLYTPDVVVEPTHASRGQTVKIRASLRNFSYERPGRVKVQFYLGEPGLGNAIGEPVLTSRDLAREQGTLEVTTTWTASGVGRQRIYAVIDPNDEIDEVHDAGDLIDNNVGYGVVTLAGDGLADMADPVAHPYDTVSYALGSPTSTDAATGATGPGSTAPSSSAHSVADASDSGVTASIHVPRDNLSGVARFEVLGALTDYQHEHIGIQVTAYQGSKYDLWHEPIDDFDLRPGGSGPPAALSVAYGDDDLGGMSESALNLYLQDAGEWVPAMCDGYDTQRFLDDNLIVVPVCKTGTFALSDKGDAPSPTNRPPYEPSGPSPAVGATDVARRLSLSWSGGDPDGDSVAYVVAGSTDVLDIHEVWCRTTDATSCRLPTVLEPNTRYHWFVTATDEHGEIAYGPTWSFETGTAVPTPARACFALAALSDAIAAIHAQNLDPAEASEIEARFYHQDGRPAESVVRSGVLPLAKTDFGLGALPGLDPGDYGVTLSSDRPIASAEMHYWPEGAAAAVGQLERSVEVVVPLIARDWEAQYSTVAIQNTDEDAPATVGIELYQQGSDSPVWTSEREIGPGTSITLRLADDSEFSGLATPFLGAMRVLSRSQAQVTAQALVHQAGDTSAVYAFEGMPAELAGDILYVPLFRSDWFGTTGINVANPNPGSVEVSVAYRGTDQADNECRGDTITQGPLTVPAHSAVNLWQGPGGGSGLPDRCFGSALIRSTGGPVMAVVNDSVLDGTAVRVSAAYTAVPASAAATSLALPFIADDAGPNQWNTGIQIMNASTAEPATVRVTFVDGEGEVIDHRPAFERVVPPGGATGMVTVFGNLGDVLWNTTGSAIVTSDRPVVALVNLFAVPFGHRDSATYNGIASY